MKLHKYEVKMNMNTYEPELGLYLTIPLRLIENIEGNSEQEQIEMLGQKVSEVFEQIKKQESKQ